MRVTKAQLAGRFRTLAALLQWDVTGPAYIPRADGQGSAAKVGYTFLEHNTVYGWSIARMHNEGGAESKIKESCSASEMDTWLGGAIFGADAARKLVTP